MVPPRGTPETPLEVTRDGTSIGTQFINEYTASETEKQRYRRIIRSTAMKSFRRWQLMQHKGRSNPRVLVEDNQESKGKTLFPRGQGPHVDFLSGPKIRKEQLNLTFGAIPTDNWRSCAATDPDDDYLSSRSTVAVRGRGSIVSPLTATCQSSQSSQSQSCVVSPIIPLGPSRIDPFIVYPLVQVDAYVHEMIDHSTTYMWPTLYPIDSSGRRTPLSSVWLERMLLRPLLMHAMLFGASVHLDVLRGQGGAVHNPKRLFHKLQTIRLLGAQLQELPRDGLDEIILSILALGTNEIETISNSRRAYQRSPFQSPLTDAQWLSVYGNMSQVEAHVVALRSLVNARGGIEEIELEGLAETLCFADIIGATQTLTKPYFPLLREFSDAKAHWSASNPFTDRLKQARGFENLSVGDMSMDVKDIIQDMCHITIEIDNYCRGSTFTLSIAAINDIRNATQHALMSLPSADEISHWENDDRSRYETLRLAIILFSIAVVFPLPGVAEIRARVVRGLKVVIERSESESVWGDDPHTFLWILVFGGMSALDMDERSWFVKRLAGLSRTLNYLSWIDAANTMNEHLWLASACDTAGRELWEEVTYEMVFIEI